MDVLTHALSGAVLGMLSRAANRSAPNSRALLASVPGGAGVSTEGAPGRGAEEAAAEIEARSADRGIRQTALIAAVLPDIDIVALIWGPFAYFRYHRGPTHSILGIVILSAALAFIMARFYPMLKKRNIFLWALAGTSLHVGLDLLTSYSTFLFWPFSGRPFFSGILRFSDRTGWYIMGASFLLGIAAKKIKTLPLKPAHFALAALVFYGGYIGARARVRYDLLSGLADHYAGTSPVRVLLTSGPLGITDWNYVVDGEGEYITGSVSYPKGTPREVSRFPKDYDPRLAEKAMSSDIARFVSGFSPFLYIKTESKESGSIVSLGDLRSGSAPRIRAEILLDPRGRVVGETYLGYRGQASRGRPVR